MLGHAAISEAPLSAVPAVALGAPATAPQIAVTGNGNAITDGDATPSLTDHTDFGAITEGGATVSRTFTVSNPGNATLNISSVTVPAGYTKTTDLPSTIAASANASLVVRLDSATAGTKSGDITINTDATPAAFNFAVTGLVEAAPSDPVDLDGGTGLGGLGGDVAVEPPVIEGAPGTRGTGRAAIRPPARLRPVCSRIVTINGFRYVRKIDDNEDS